MLATDIPDVIENVLSRTIQANPPSGSSRYGIVQVRELDWTVPPSDWTWTDSEVVASHSLSPTDTRAPQTEVPELVEAETLLKPPFDMIVTSDTIYTPSLVRPLLRTLHHLSHLSSPITKEVGALSKSKHSNRHPPIYLALENRDNNLVDLFFAQARDEWHFICTKMPQRKLAKLLEKGGASWNRDEWIGVEVWKLTASS